MTQTIEPQQQSIAAFANQPLAEQALQALQEAGFAGDRVCLITQTPPVKATEAKKSGIRGAVTGALGGGLAGLILSFAKTTLVGDSSTVEPLRNSIGLFLVGSLVGAIGLGIIGAMSGVNVRQQHTGTQVGGLLSSFVLYAKDLQPDELSRAREIAQPYATENLQY